ncbi:MAG: alginate lyase family protein [Spirochaetes bacterium]|nr:alginate lyase family protein [Spirochaetota bacterium]
MDFIFIINRIRRMSPPEMAFRVIKLIQNKFESHYLNLNCKIPDYKEPDHLLFNNIDFSTFESSALLKQADQLCGNRMNIFSLIDYDIGEKIDYHKDYKSGLRAPRNIFGKNIDYRDSKKIGDIKYIWEPNRHLFLFPLALTYRIYGKKNYLEKFSYYLSEWLHQNPFMYGVNWCSSLELGIRLINWALCWHLVKNEIDKELSDKWAASIYQHCRFISKNLSRYSSANNHLIGEIAGLFIAGTALPQFKESKKWRNISYKILKNECNKQNYKDGVNKEQAISYQQFTLDFFMLAGIIAKKYNIIFPENYWKRIEKMLEFIAAVEDLNGNIPQTGDEDDALVIDLGQREYGIYRSLLNTGAYIFNRCDFSKNINPDNIDLKTKIFLNLNDTKITNSLKSEKQIPLQFPEGGYYVLGTNINKKNEQKLIFDCGPLGYLSIAAHGHADALSFTFSAGGFPIFIDPGTYAYHSNREWRNYFRGTSAHNTLTVDNENQSYIAGNFMWSRKAKTKILNYSEPFSIEGTHFGYKSKKSTVHNRIITYNKLNNFWEIVDNIITGGEHNINVYFHCSPSCAVTLAEKHVDIKFPGGDCKLYYDDNINVSLHNAEINPILGWYSPSYDVKNPATAIKLSMDISGNTSICSKFEINFTQEKLYEH